MIPLYKQGLDTIKMPVHCTDVSKAAIKAILDPESNGKTFEIVGWALLLIIKFTLPLQWQG